MFLDEILVQQEIERSRGDKGQRLEEIKEEILKKQREQKPIPEFVEELRNGSVTLGGRTYRCEQKQVLEGAVSVLLLPDDVEQVIENKPAAHIQYRSLQIGETVFYVDSPVMIKDEQEYRYGTYETGKADDLLCYRDHGERCRSALYHQLFHYRQAGLCIRQSDLQIAGEVYV